MVSNAYSSIKIKWFIDFKYISIYKILYHLGIIGFFFSLLLLFISNFIPCGDTPFIKYVCQIEYNNSTFFDSFMNLKQIIENKNKYLDIFFILPLFMISSFLNVLFEISIIKNLDPFYLIPIESIYFLIYEIIDYCITYSETNLFRNIKFAFEITSNTVSVFLCCIYLEIIHLNCYDLNRDTRTKILEREKKEQDSIMLTSFINESKNEDEEINN